MSALLPVRFAVVGVDHVHVFGMIGALREAGAVLTAFHVLEPAQQAEGFAKLFPDVRRVDDLRAVLEDRTVGLVVCAAAPHRRAAIAAAAMEHGKDVLVDKPAALTSDDLATLRAVQADTRRLFSVYFSERIASRATEKALDLVRAGAIGRPIALTALGPHQLGLVRRPDWFWDPARAGGILVDLASHPIDQFLCAFGEGPVAVASARTANRATPERPAFEDFGELLLRTPSGSGYARLDWCTPAGLGTWGDGRLFLLGSEGTIEVRKQCDPAGRPGGDHLLLVDARETRYLDCSAEPLPFAARLLRDVRERTETAMPAAHALRVCALALEAQALALSGDDRR